MATVAATGYTPNQHSTISLTRYYLQLDDPLIEENKESAATGGNDQDRTLTNQLEEFKESNIIFKAEGSKKTEPEQRKAEDIALVNELCKITGTNKQTVKNVTRLGKECRF
jgi:hypothetical protein